MAEATNSSVVLVVDDDKPTADLVTRVLSRSGQATKTADCASSAITLLQYERFDMVLLDYMLGDNDCWSVLEVAKRLNPPVPVVLVTGSGSERVAVEAMRRGALDYVIKNGDYWQQLPEIVARTVETANSARLRDTLAATVASSQDGIIGCTPSGDITSWNPGAQAIFGFPAADKIGKSAFELFSRNHRAEVQRRFEALSRDERAGNFDTIGITQDQNAVHLSVGFSATKDEHNRLSSITILARDITDPQWASSMQGLAILSD